MALEFSSDQAACDQTFRGVGNSDCALIYLSVSIKHRICIILPYSDRFCLFLVACPITQILQIPKEGDSETLAFGIKRCQVLPLPSFSSFFSFLSLTDSDQITSLFGSLIIII